MDPAPKRKDKVAETNEEMFGDDVDLDTDTKRRRIVSQLSKREVIVDKLPINKNVPNVKDKLRKTINRFNRFKRNTVKNVII
jgi:hypothetical protein